MDLHAPLGQERKDKNQGRRRLGLSTVTSVLAVAMLAGVSVWTSMSPTELRSEAPINLTPAPPETTVASDDAAAREHDGRAGRHCNERPE